MKTYEELMRADYNKSATTQAFRELVKKPKDRDLIGRAFELSMPVLGVLMKSKFKIVRPGTEEYDEILSSVPAAFFMYMNTDRFYDRYYDDEDSLFSFLFGLFRFEILNALKKTRKNVARMESDGKYGYTPMSSCMSRTQSTVEHRLYLRQFGSLILKNVLDKNRFSGTDKLLVETILPLLLAGKHVPYSILSQDPGIKRDRASFFVDYIRVLIRSALMDEKERVGDLHRISEQDEFDGMIERMENL